jgi:hypothetical protein
VGQEAVDSSRASVGELLADISSDLSTLMRQEMDLAKAEIRQSASRAGKGAGILAAAASRVSSSWFRFGRGVVGAGRFHRPRLVRTRRRRHLVDHRRRTRARRPVGGVVRDGSVPDEGNSQEDPECSQGERGATMSDPDQIRASIEQTAPNSATTRTPGGQGQSVPRRQATSQQGTLAAGRARETVMRAASDLGTSASSAASSTKSTVADSPNTIAAHTAGNPLAAGLIAFGIGWLIGSLLPVSEQEQQAAVNVKETALPVVSDAAKEVADNLKEPAQQAVDTVKESATVAVETVKDESSSAAQDVKEQAADAKDTVQQNR